MGKIISTLVLITAIIFTFSADTYTYGETMHKKTIAIDLDGVLNNYTKYTDDIPEIKDGAKDFIINLAKSNELILYTNRSPKLATKWLIKHNLDKYFTEVTNVKPVAYMYIDDRAIQFNGDYNKTLEEIQNFKVYWNE